MTAPGLPPSHHRNSFNCIHLEQRDFQKIQNREQEVEDQLGQETTNDTGYNKISRILTRSIPQLACTCKNSGAVRTVATTESGQIDATLGDKQEARTYSSMVNFDGDGCIWNRSNLERTAMDSTVIP
jgi:hypothetical protein